MKKLSVYLFAILFLAGCSPNLPELTEEDEYENYVAAVKAETANNERPPLEWKRIHEEAYKESDLRNKITHAFRFDDEKQSIEELNGIYEDVVIRKYEGHASQDHLKLKFVSHVVNGLNLRTPESPEAGEFLVIMTRELVSADQALDLGLTYDCLSACKERMEAKEFDELVKKATFQIRFRLEDMQHMAADDRYTSVIKTFEQTLSDLQDLRSN